MRNSTARLAVLSNCPLKTKSVIVFPALRNWQCHIIEKSNIFVNGALKKNNIISESTDIFIIKKVLQDNAVVTCSA